MGRALHSPSEELTGEKFTQKAHSSGPAGFDISGFRPDTRVILRAMKKHGLIVADNGSNWFFGGTAEEGWNNAMLDELKTIPARRLVAHGGP